MLYWIPTKKFDHTPPLFQNGAFWRPKTRFEAVLRSKSSSKTRFAKRLKVWIYSRNFSISNYMIFGHFNSTRKLIELNQSCWSVGLHVYKMKNKFLKHISYGFQNAKRFENVHFNFYYDENCYKSFFFVKMRNTTKTRFFFLYTLKTLRFFDFVNMKNASKCFFIWQKRNNAWKTCFHFVTIKNTSKTCFSIL